jgi:hypothetical protein
MPVLFDSSTTSVTTVAGSSSTGTTSATHQVSTIVSNLYALVAVYWSGSVSASGATFSVTFGGHSMTLVSGGQALWGSNQGTVLLYYLANPPTGAKTVTASYTGMPTSGTTQLLAFASGTWWGVAGIGSATTAVGPGNSPSLTVPSASGQMVANAIGTVSAAAAGQITSYNQTSRYNVAYTSGSNGPLQIGDAAGAASVSFTAADAYEVAWTALGIPLVGASVSYDATGGGKSGYGTGLSYSHTFSGSNRAAVAFVTVTSTIPSPTVTVQIGATPMTAVAAAPNYYSITLGNWFTGYTTYYTGLYAFGLLTPPLGAQTVSMTVNSNSYAAMNSVSYDGVLSFGLPAISSATVEPLNIASTTPANSVIAAHGVSPIANSFTYNQVKRAVAAYGADQLLLLGEAPGSPLVSSIATTSNPQGNWGAVGVNLAPAPVMLNVSALIGPIITSTRLADYRVHTASPLRTWTIEAGQGQVVTTPFGIGQEWTQSFDSVLDYTLDWTAWLAITGDTIANATFTPSDPAISVVSVNTTADVATAWLTGGLNGNAYAIKVHIVTEFGRQDDRTFLLNIDQT